MELRILRYFLAVIDTGSVTAAAGAVHVSQPSLSRQLRGFERSLGLTLFDRRDNRLVLTSAGRQFVPIARDLVVRADRAERAATAIRAGRLDRITIAAPGTTLTDVVAPYLATWSAEDPMPSVWEESPAHIYQSLYRGADIAIGTEPPADLDWSPIAVLPVWAFVRSDHAWAGRREVSLADLLAAELLLLRGDQHSRRSLDHAVTEAELSLGMATEFAAPEVAQAVAAAGRGVAVVSDDPRFGLEPVAIGVGARRRLSIRLYGAWVADHPGASALAEVVQRLSAFCVARYGVSTRPTPRSAGRWTKGRHEIPG